MQLSCFWVSHLRGGEVGGLDIVTVSFRPLETSSTR